MEPICVQFPQPGQLQVRLPFGGVALKSIVDPSMGPPTDCTLITGLMLQLAPALAGMECFLKLLNLAKAIKDIDPKNPVSALTSIVDAASKLAECLLFPAHILCMILDVLKLIIRYLNCIIDAILSILEFKATLQFDSAEGNPVVLASLDCANKGASSSLTSLKEAMEAVTALLSLVEPVMSMAEGIPGPVGDIFKAIPGTITQIGNSFDNTGVGVGISGIAGIQEVINKLKGIQDQLRQMLDTLESIPC